MSLRILTGGGGGGLDAITTAERDALSPELHDLIFNRDRGFQERYTGFPYAPWQQEGVKAYAHEDGRSYGAVTGQNKDGPPATDSLMADMAAALACYSYNNRGKVASATGIRWSGLAEADQWGTLTVANAETTITTDLYSGITLSASADSGTANTLTDTGAFTALGDLVGAILTIRPGTSSQESRPITTKTDDVLSTPPYWPWIVNPGVGTAYRVTHKRGTTGYMLAIVRGTGQGQEAEIVQHTATVFYLDRPWETLPDSTSEYRIILSAITSQRRWDRALYLSGGNRLWRGSLTAMRGVVSPKVFGDGMELTTIYGEYGVTETSFDSATTTTITKTGAGWKTNQWRNSYAMVWPETRTAEEMLTAGGCGTSMRIVSNTSDTITFQSSIGFTPIAGTGSGSHRFAIAADSILMYNGVNDGVFQNYGLRGSPGAEFLWAEHYTWITNISTTQAGNDHPLRTALSSSQNSWYNIDVTGDYIKVGWKAGSDEAPNMQIDNSRRYGCRVRGGKSDTSMTSGGWAAGRMGTHWFKGGEGGGGLFGNCVIHNQYGGAYYTSWFGYTCSATDMGLYSVSLQNHYCDIVINGIASYAFLRGCWSENSSYFLRSTLATEATVGISIEGVDFKILSGIYDPANLGYWIEWKYPAPINIVNSHTTGEVGAKTDKIYILGAGRNGASPAKLLAFGLTTQQPVESVITGGAVGVLIGYTEREANGLTVETTPFYPLDYGASGGLVLGASGAGPDVHLYRKGAGAAGLSGALTAYGRGVRLEKIAKPAAPGLTNFDGNLTETATSAGTTTTTNNSIAGYTVNALVNAFIKPITGANAGQARKLISANTATQVTHAAFTNATASGDTYQIVQDYVYRYVGIDSGGKETAPSDPATIEGPFPQGTRRIWLLQPTGNESGVAKITVLKGDTATKITNLTGIRARRFPVFDSGQATSAYTAQTVNQTGGVFSGEPHVLTYGTTVSVDAAQGNYQTLSVTNGVGFTIASPTNAVSGQSLTLSIKNDSGGAMGAVTLGSEYKLDPATFTGPANGKRRQIVVTREGSEWVGFSTADIG